MYIEYGLLAYIECTTRAELSKQTTVLPVQKGSKLNTSAKCRE